MRLKFTTQYYTPTLLTGDIKHTDVVGMQEHWIGAAWAAGKGLYADRVWEGRNIIASRNNE